MKQIYQGDICILGRDTIPSDVELKPLRTEGIVIAEGEVTGHRHILTAEKPELVQIGRNADGFWLKVGEGANATLVHEEHKVAEVLPGFRFIGRQVEYDEIEEIRRVKD